MTDECVVLQFPVREQSVEPPNIIDVMMADYDELQKEKDEIYYAYQVASRHSTHAELNGAAKGIREIAYCLEKGGPSNMSDLPDMSAELRAELSAWVEQYAKRYDEALAWEPSAKDCQVERLEKERDF